MTQLTVKVVRKTREAQDIAGFELARPDGGALPGFSAGSHIDVHLPGGGTRQYSLCNDSAETHRYRIAVLRDPNTRGGSASMHDAVREGDTIQISEPRNHFPLVHAARTLLFAGGIGVTPLLCMAQRLAKIGSDFTLHYSTRSPERTAFRDEILASGFSDRVVFHFDDGAADQILNVPAVVGTPDPGTHLYVCGPAGYINHVLQVAQGMGWPSAQIHLEYFSATPQDTAGDRAFDVKLASSGKTYRVEANETVVQALARQGVEILYSCEQGVCGTCITRVLEGECDHRDMYFTDEEKAKNDQFTPCCSRAKSSLLVLDL
ncbi:MAG TPA: PDR/VanB family oxidoreductase [Ramlibacter sp.]|uniref:PDR/VanB family oxidoreductase n=1 Tax=Ramlibacter sp. TaxID=1917967 RepID=UPI002C43F137|nr:PDR/VanB family oxidoreductase [Ramlibacter sp.]HVZ44497.1 PDR/VanB family oxidoreductase [Ramlibacter sp.]